MPEAVRRLFLIDSMGYIFRAYHQPQTQRFYTRGGLPSGAIFVFNNMLRKLLKEYQPEYVAAIFDAAGPTFRDELFADYKANRAEMPAELARQIPYIRRLLEALRIPVIESPKYEADDVIGALAAQGARAGMEVTIVSSDKDMLQLVTRDGRDGKQGAGTVCVLIPTKDDLICDAAKVEEVLGVPPRLVPDVMALRGDAIDNIPGAPGIGEKGSRDLIRRFGSVEGALEHAAEVERKTYRESLLNHRDQILQSKKLATIETQAPVELRLEEIAAHEPDRAALQQFYKELEFHSLAQELLPPADTQQKDYAELATEAEVAAFVEKLPDETAFVLVEAAEGQMNFAPGIAVSPETGVARLAPLRLIGLARAWLEDAGRGKSVSNAKAALRALGRHGVVLRGVYHDTLLYSYLLDPTLASHDLPAAAERHFGVRRGESALEHADVLGQLARALAADVDARGLARLYAEIELPLAPVLARMEEIGVRIDGAELARLSVQLAGQIDAVSAEIFQLCGGEFNINSPQQLSKVLFEQLKLPAPVKHGQGKVQSTAVEVLESLAEAHEAPRKVLEYRQLSKLKGTYIDALPRLVSQRTGRIHTTFDQAGTATGRLSSRDPNLQNIPIRTELGRQIRAAFVAEPGWKILSADYSQIELRLLAHLSKDPVLLEAFRANQDIHSRTAELVFGVPPLLQTHEHRRRSKAINYGIVYGLSPFGLAQQLGIDRAEAREFIDNYFRTYAGVKRYSDACLEEVRKTGEVRTLYGRLRPIPEINSRNQQQRGFAERTAINTPLQGTAADLIKVAMIRIDRELAAVGLETRMLLQVHDELLFEAPAAEVDAARGLVRRAMEGAALLDVPLVADVGAGDNWRDAK